MLHPPDYGNKCLNPQLNIRHSLETPMEVGEEGLKEPESSRTPQGTLQNQLPWAL